MQIVSTVAGWLERLTNITFGLVGINAAELVRRVRVSTLGIPVRLSTPLAWSAVSLPRDMAAPPLVKTKPSRIVSRPPFYNGSTSTLLSRSSTLFSVSGAGGRNANGWVYSGLQLANDDKYSDEDRKTGRLLMVRSISIRQLSSYVHLSLFLFLSP